VYYQHIIINILLSTSVLSLLLFFFLLFDRLCGTTIHIIHEPAIGEMRLVKKRKREEKQVKKQVKNQIIKEKKKRYKREILKRFFLVNSLSFSTNTNSIVRLTPEK
jgi:hypothetical protein